MLDTYQKSDRQQERNNGRETQREKVIKKNGMYEKKNESQKRKWRRVEKEKYVGN